MLKGNDLVCPGKDNLVLSHDVSAPDSLNTDLLLLSLLPLRASVILVLILVVQHLVHGIRKRDGRPAGSVHLLIVMFLHNLNVKSRRHKYRCGLLQKIHQRIDTQGHIGALEYRHLPAGLLYLRQLFLRQSCGAQHHRNLMFHTVIQQIIHRGRTGEIDDHIRLHVAGLQAGEYRVVIFDPVEGIHTRHNLYLLVIRAKAGNGLPHMAVASVHNRSYHNLFLSCLLMSPTADRNPSWPAPASSRSPRPSHTAATAGIPPAFPSGSTLS